MTNCKIRMRFSFSKFPPNFLKHQKETLTLKRNHNIISWLSFIFPKVSLNFLKHQIETLTLFVEMFLPIKEIVR